MIGGCIFSYNFFPQSKKMVPDMKTGRGGHRPPRLGRSPDRKTPPYNTPYYIPYGIPYNTP